MKVSLVIRAYNEAASLRMLLEALESQDYPKDRVELVVVDNGSTDETVAVAREFGAKIVSLKQEAFSYPKSSNLGIKAASGELVCLVSAHALPLSDGWLSKGEAHFNDETVAGVFGPTFAAVHVSRFEWLLGLPAFAAAKLGRPVRFRRSRTGVLGATNCIIRRDLWKKHQFDEAYGAGGEDAAWAEWAFSQGLEIVFEPGFAVWHAHGHGPLGYIKQQKLWRSLKTPRPFNREELAFRKDLR